MATNDMIKDSEYTGWWLEIAKDKDPGIFEVDVKRYGNACGNETVGGGALEYKGPARGTASSWDLLLQKVARLGLPADCLQEAKQKLDRDGSVKIDLEAA
jgi:hypothetical protein